MDSNYELKYLFSCEEVNRLVAWVYQLKPIYGNKINQEE